MADKYTKYTTKPGDRWDTVAFKAYGDPGRGPEIMAANPGLAITDVLPEGVEIRVPITAAAADNPNPLPPWKR